MKPSSRCRDHAVIYNIYILTREINYCCQTDRSRKVREVSIWHCHSSLRFLPEGIAPDLGAARRVGHPASSEWLLPEAVMISLCSLCCTPVNPDELSAPTTADKAKLTYVFDHGSSFITHLCLSMCVCESVCDQERESNRDSMLDWTPEKTHLAPSKEPKSHDDFTGSFSSLLVNWCPADVLGHFLYISTALCVRFYFIMSSSVLWIFCLWSVIWATGLDRPFLWAVYCIIM